MNSVSVLECWGRSLRQAASFTLRIGCTLSCYNFNMVCAMHCMWIAPIQVYLKFGWAPGRKLVSLQASVTHWHQFVLISILFPIHCMWIARIQVHLKCQEAQGIGHAVQVHQSWSNSNSGMLWITFIWMLWLRESCIKYTTNHLRFGFRPLASTLLSFTALDSLTKKLDVTVKDLWG